MIRFYLCPMVDDGKSSQLKQAYGWHPMIMDLPREPGQTIRCPGAHPSGWTLVMVDRSDHSGIIAHPQVDALMPELMGPVQTKVGAIAATQATPLGNSRTKAVSLLEKYGIPSGGLATGRSFLDRALHEIDPMANLESLF